MGGSGMRGRERERDRVVGREESLVGRMRDCGFRMYCVVL